VKKLLDVLRSLVEAGNTVVVIEHNMDVIKVADHIIDLGPEGGDEGGRVVATGPPEVLAEHPTSYTGRYLREVLAKDRGYGRFSVDPSASHVPAASPLKPAKSDAKNNKKPKVKSTSTRRNRKATAN
jgi:excinuclease ABC subunit A